MAEANGRISLTVIFHGVATLAVLGIFGMVWSFRDDVSDLKTDVAVMKVDIRRLTTTDIPSRGEVAGMIEHWRSPWMTERDDWMAWRSRVDAAMEKK